MAQIRPTPHFCEQYRRLESDDEVRSRLSARDIRTSIRNSLTEEQWYSLNALEKTGAAILNLRVNGRTYDILFWRQPKRGRNYRAQEIIEQAEA